MTMMMMDADVMKSLTVRSW